MTDDRTQQAAPGSHPVLDRGDAGSTPTDDRTRPAASGANPVATGEYVPDSTPDPASTRPTAPPAGGRPRGDVPDIPGYAVAHEIARGGMGRVLAATDLGFDREVAIKVLLPGFHAGAAAGRFVREARITGRLSHPGIPPAHHLGTLPDGSPFLAMKLVRGRTLADLLKDRPTPAHDLPRFVGVVEQIAQAVGYAHSRGVIHRDLKPANVMVGEFGEVQVMDWGLARDSEEKGVGSEETEADSRPLPTPHSPLLTAQGAVMGTPAYMAPEQARGDDVDARADVFALGGVLCAVLTGAAPFRGASGDEVVVKAAAGDLADALARLAACGADAELVDVARACLAPDPAARPADGTAAAALVAAYRAGVEERLRAAERDRAAAEAAAAEEANTRREAEAKVAEQRKRRRVQGWLAAAAVLLVAGAGGVAVWRVVEDGNKRVEAERLAGEDRDRKRQSADAVAGLLDQAKVALEAGDAARADPFLAQARKRAADGGVTDHADRAAAYARDAAMLRALDKVDDDRWTAADGNKYPPAERVAGWLAAAFAGYGVEPGKTPAAEVAARVNATPIRPALVAALDVWLAAGGSDAVRDALRAADPDPFRDEARRLLAARDAAGLEVLAGRAEWARQPAGLFLGYALVPRVAPATARELLLGQVYARRADFGLLTQLGLLYPNNTPAGVAERARWFQAAVALRPGNAAALNNLGVTLIDAGNPAGAAAACAAALEIAPGYALAHGNLGLARRRLGDPAGAEAACREAVRLDPTLAMAWNNLGVFLRERGDRAGAEAAFRDGLRHNPGAAKLHDGLGVARGDAGDYDGAVAAHREAVRLDPNFALAQNNLGTALVVVGDADGAIAAFRDAIRLDPALAESHNGLGRAYRTAGDRAAAEAAYREAIRLDPKHARAHTGLGTTLQDAGDRAGAEAAFREATRLDPDYPIAHLDLGRLLRETGDRAGAVAALREAARLAPELADAHATLGAALQETGDQDAAIAACREAIRLDPKAAFPHNVTGNARWAKGDRAGAAAAFREATRLDPDYRLAHVNLGRVLRDDGDGAGAVAPLRAAVRLDPTAADVHADLGAALQETGDQDGAVAALREAIRLDPRAAFPHNVLGNALRAKGDPDGAVAAFRDAVRINPRYALALQNLGLTLLDDKRDVPAALAAFRAGTRAAPAWPSMWVNLGATLERSSDPWGAEEAYREALRLNPRYALAHANLGDALRVQGRHADAAEAFRAAITLDPTNAAARAGLNYSRRVERGEVPTAPPPRAAGR